MTRRSRTSTTRMKWRRRSRTRTRSRTTRIMTTPAMSSSRRTKTRTRKTRTRSCRRTRTRSNLKMGCHRYHRTDERLTFSLHSRTCLQLGDSSPLEQVSTLMVECSPHLQKFVHLLDNRFPVLLPNLNQTLYRRLLNTHCKLLVPVLFYEQALIWIYSRNNWINKSRMVPVPVPYGYELYF